MSKKLTTTQLKKQLKECSQDELIDLISRIYKAVPETADFINVELGDQEYNMNMEFGASMAGCCDTAVLVGKKRSEAIAEGLRQNGFPEESIKIVSSLEEATEIIKTIAESGDTVLFENDLPDHYTE